jgi:predicted regulator of Ras-like GTPase activity (Roadblock/LC7/MglB family)
VTREESAALAETVRAGLATLKDIAGVSGSFVCTQSGRVVAREIPAVFEDAVLMEAGSRLLRVAETFGAGGDELELAVVRYGEHRLYLKAIPGGMLCIVVAGPVNMPALRMAANLVTRRIAVAVARAQSELPPAASEPVAAAPPVGAPAPKPAPAGMRRFRGREIC